MCISCEFGFYRRHILAKILAAKKTSFYCQRNKLKRYGISLENKLAILKIYRDFGEYFERVYGMYLMCIQDLIEAFRSVSYPSIKASKCVPKGRRKKTKMS